MVTATLPGIMLYACLLVAHADAFAPTATAHKCTSMIATRSCGRHIRATRPTATVPLPFNRATSAEFRRAFGANLPESEECAGT